MIYILHATNTKHNEQFIELFTSIKSLNTFLNNHPYVSKQQITGHELNPQ